jgi:hypothetical protein
LRVKVLWKEGETAKELSRRKCFYDNSPSSSFNITTKKPQLNKFFEFFVHSQGSNNSSDQSSGYLSGSGGSSSLPANANVIDATQSHFDYNFGQTRFETLNSHHQQQQDSKSSKKYSLTSSLMEYPSSHGSNAERELEFNNGEK